MKKARLLILVLVITLGVDILPAQAISLQEAAKEASTLARQQKNIKSREAGNRKARLFQQLTKGVAWVVTDKVLLEFNTFHPQGVVKIGENYYMSSVEKIKSTKKFAKPDERGRDRTVGKGKGHLFKFSEEGQLLGHLELGEGAVYHPGGIDFDGEFIWVPVAEYRPNSDSIIYKIRVDSFEAVEVFRVKDHIGGVIHDTEEDHIYGVSWGSRNLYKWTPEGKFLTMRSNGAHYIDYQDCKYLGGDWMLCSGLNKFSSATPPFVLGGLELINLETETVTHQVPITAYTPSGTVMSQNPMEIGLHQEGLRFYFIPEDNTSTLYILEANPK